MTRKRSAVRCPTCGRLTLRPAVRTVLTRRGSRKFPVPDVRGEDCSACGERRYDLSALRKIAAARSSARRRHVA